MTETGCQAPPMRAASLLAWITMAAALSGCFADDGAESATPGPTQDPAPFDPSSVDTTGCTGEHVGSGTGDIGAPRACNETNETNASV
jgi:hypothetical protein